MPIKLAEMTGNSYLGAAGFAGFDGARGADFGIEFGVAFGGAFGGESGGALLPNNSRKAPKASSASATLSRGVLAEAA